MITTVDPSYVEVMYVDSTDAESPRVEGPPEEEAEKEPRLEKEKEYGEDKEAENEQDEPPPPEYNTPDKDHILPARRTNRGGAELGDH
jgi:hypothetical protein